MNEFKNKLKQNISQAYKHRTVTQDALGDIWIQINEQEDIDEVCSNITSEIEKLPAIKLPPERVRIFIFEKNKQNAVKLVLNSLDLDLKNS